MNDVLLGLQQKSRLWTDDADRMTPVGSVSRASRQAAPRSLRIGIIASEFPPDHGGMQEHARGLVGSLARDHQLQVFVSPGLDGVGSMQNIDMHPVMCWQPSLDLPLLRRASVDAWITLNAGLASYGPGLSAPLFAYVHGNDFTRPWLPQPERHVRLVRRVGGKWLDGEAVVRRWRKRRIAAGLRAARWMFANSAFSRDLCARMYGLPAERITVVPPGMRREFFQTGNPSSSGRLRLVTVSRLTASAERKNIDGVLEAVAQLRGEIDMTYTVIGDGDDLPRLRARAVALGLATDVRFLGSVDTQRVIEEFGQSDVFVMPVRPSKGDVEGFGMVYAEAAATGLPSIGTNTGGIPDVIEHGVTGLLLDDVSAGGIANGLRRFHRSRANFDRSVIRTRAERFSARCCSASIAQIITAMT